MTSQKTTDGSWGRQEWVAFADRLLAPATTHFAPGAAQLQLPGAEGGYGRRVDGMEAFTRVFLLAALRSAGEPEGSHERLAPFAEGLVTGTTPGRPTSWPRLSEHGQAKVEAAALALALDLTRPWLWQRLDAREQRQVVDYLAEAVGDDTYPRINWVWFRLMVQTFLRSVDGPHHLDEMRADLATHDTFARADGWMADGDARSYDHYVGWVLHLFPALWARMSGSQGLVEARREADRAALDRYLVDAVRLVGADGSPLVQGRSLIYRFAAAAPFWAGVLSDVPSVSAGQLRRASELVVRHFVDHGVPNRDGLLDLGWHHAWPKLAQSYSGPGSPYWASFGLLGVAFDRDHPVWRAPAEPLPVEVADSLFTVRAPGWLVSSTVADGIVRVVNHGTDHGHEGQPGTDSPLYARLGYSTATSPLLDDEAWRSPADNSVGVSDAAGRISHRTGWRAGPLVVEGGVGIASSSGTVGWMAASAALDGHDTGAGVVEPAAELTVASLVRGRWEVRLARVGRVLDERVVTLRFCGWPVAGDATGELRPVPLTEDEADGPSVERAEHRDASPLADLVTVAWCEAPVAVGRWRAVLVTLGRGEVPAEQSCQVEVADLDAAVQVSVQWPDGHSSEHRVELV